MWRVFAVCTYGRMDRLITAKTADKAIATAWGRASRAGIQLTRKEFLEQTTVWPVFSRHAERIMSHA